MDGSKQRRTREIQPSEHVSEAIHLLIAPQVNTTLDGLIAKCKKLVDEGDEEFVEEFLSEADPSILHFLLAS